MLPRYEEDVSALHVGTCPCRANYLPEGAVTSLDGEWAFKWYDRVRDVPDEIASLPLEGAVPIPVPSVWQNHGFDRHQYVNTRYPFPYDPPYVPVQNPCGVYRRSFEHAREGGRCYLCFDGVDSCFYVWLNGRFVGFSQVSHTTSEFDVTQALRKGENELTVAVVKWCFGSYLEDQDKFRMSGIFRSVYLIDRPEQHLWDLTLTGTPEGDIDCRATFTGEPLPLHAALFSPEGERLALADSEGGKVHFHVDEPRLWTAETPNLYTLKLVCAGETILRRVGLRRVEVRGGTVLLNGSPLRIRGVNRHDSDPVRGYAVTQEDVLRDMRLMKALNVNAIRTSHYPNAPFFYDMADEYGFYLCAEADVESHGAQMVYGKHDLSDYAQLARMPLYHDVFLDRVQRNVIQHKNHASVILWSLGNESGYGDNLADAARWTRHYDPTRLVHYENEYAHHPDYRVDESLLDVKSSMYPTIESLDAYFEDPANTRPYVLCEYAHAMGLGPGDLEAYWRCFDRHPGLLGGFIWEWCDHALFAGVTPDGRSKFLYGGDSGEEPHDGNFCVDGLVLPDRTLSRGALEMKNVYRPIRCEGLSEDGRGVLLRNTLDFVDLCERYTLRWALQENGVTVSSGETALPSIPARCTRPVALPLPVKPQGDVRLLLTAVRKVAAPGQQPGEDAGFDQIILSQAQKMLPKQPSGGVSVEEKDGLIHVEGPNFHYVYDTDAAAFARMTFGDHALLERPMAFNIWRAPIDNDMHVVQNWREAGYDRAITRAYGTRISSADGLVAIETNFSLVAVSLQRILTATATWRIGADGSVQLEVRAEKCARMPDLPRFGLRLFLPEAMNAVQYLGYGPCESYADLRHACYRARFSANVDDLAGPFVKPQECAGRFGCDWVCLSGDELGLLCESETPFSFSASAYTQEELTEKKHAFELERSGMTVLCLDYRHCGIGSNACGPKLDSAYVFDETHFSFALRLTPKAAN